MRHTLSLLELLSSFVSPSSRSSLLLLMSSPSPSSKIMQYKKAYATLPSGLSDFLPFASAFERIFISIRVSRMESVFVSLNGGVSAFLVPVVV